MTIKKDLSRMNIMFLIASAILLSLAAVVSGIQIVSVDQPLTGEIGKPISFNLTFRGGSGEHYGIVCVALMLPDYWDVVNVTVNKTVSSYKYNLSLVPVPALPTSSGYQTWKPAEGYYWWVGCSARCNSDYPQSWEACLVANESAVGNITLMPATGGSFKLNYSMGAKSVSSLSESWSGNKMEKPITITSAQGNPRRAIYSYNSSTKMIVRSSDGNTFQNVSLLGICTNAEIVSDENDFLFINCNGILHVFDIKSNQDNIIILPSGVSSIKLEGAIYGNVYLSGTDNTNVYCGEGNVDYYGDVSIVSGTRQPYVIKCSAYTRKCELIKLPTWLYGPASGSLGGLIGGSFNYYYVATCQPGDTRKVLPTGSNSFIVFNDYFATHDITGIYFESTPGRIRPTCGKAMIYRGGNWFQMDTEDVTSNTRYRWGYIDYYDSDYYNSNARTKGILRTKSLPDTYSLFSSSDFGVFGTEFFPTFDSGLSSSNFYPYYPSLLKYTPMFFLNGTSIVNEILNGGSLLPPFSPFGTPTIKIRDYFFNHSIPYTYGWSLYDRVNHSTMAFYKNYSYLPIMQKISPTRINYSQARLFEFNTSNKKLVLTGNKNIIAHGNLTVGVSENSYSLLSIVLNETDVFFYKVSEYRKYALANFYPPVCGNGALESGEQCDDGNTVAGDGCSATCMLEGCPNGILDPGEQCDDSNAISGDGCSNLCQLEICGNNFKDVNEACDGTDLAGQNCVASGFDTGILVCAADCSAFDTTGCSYICGNGILSSGEQCDDGNTASGDGCSADCKIEHIAYVTLPKIANVYKAKMIVTGNNAINSKIDVGSDGTIDWSYSGTLDNPVYVDVASALNDSIKNCQQPDYGTCRIPILFNADSGSMTAGDIDIEFTNFYWNTTLFPESKYYILGVTVSEARSFCGNNRIEFEEECDDGNRVTGDGCTMLCKNEYCGDNICSIGETCMVDNCCNGASANLQTDASNCGSCGNVCTAGQTCQAGICVKPALSCVYKAGACDAGYTKVLEASNFTDAHSSLPGLSQFGYSICCRILNAADPTLTTICGTTFLQLSDPSNDAHVQENATVGFTHNACMNAAAGTIQCAYTTNAPSTDCSSLNADTCVASITDASDAHIGNCTAYSTKVCCWLGIALPPTPPPPPPPTGALACSIKSDCSAGEVGLFSMYDLTNSHVGTLNYYTNKVCCNLTGTTAVLGNDCAAANKAFVLTKFQANNSHVSVTSGYYTNDVCLNVSSGSVSCNIRSVSGSCPAGETCIATVNDGDGNTDDSHVAGCAGTPAPYAKTICCSYNS